LLPAELIVLSACETGLGKEIKAEGLVGLTRGFMYAGSTRVVSLWSVNDKDFGFFYSCQLNGHGMSLKIIWDNLFFGSL
jgi:hypothetical protein